MLLVWFFRVMIVWDLCFAFINLHKGNSGMSVFFFTLVAAALICERLKVKQLEGEE
jgi:hypothetical protein